MPIELPALAIQPQAPYDPIGQVAKIQAVQMQPLRQEEARQQLQMGQLEQQQRELDLQDQKAMTAAMHEWDGSSPDSLPGLIMKHGGSAKAVLGMRSSLLEQKAKLTQIAKDDAETGKNQLANLSARNDMLLGALNGVTSGPDEGLQDRLMAAAQSAVQNGLLDPQHAQIIQPLTQIQDPAELRKQLTLFEKSLSGNAAQLEQAQKLVTIGKEQAQTAEAQASTQKATLENQALQQFGGLSPSMLESKYVFLKQRQDAGKPLATDDQAFMKAYEQQKTLVPTATFNLQNAGVSGGGAAPSAVAQAIAGGQMAWQDAVSPRTPFAVKEALLKEVKGINPEFNSGDFAVEKKVREAFTSGTPAANLTAFDTAIDHAKQLRQAANALDNGDVRAMNAIGNQLGYQFGSDKTTNFNVIKSALSGEISKVFKGGQATDAEIRDVQQPFSAANSPAQLKGAIDNAVRLMTSKRDHLQKQYEAGRQGKPNFGDETSGEVTATGPNGHKIVVRGGQWVDAQTGQPIK